MPQIKSFKHLSLLPLTGLVEVRSLVQARAHAHAHTHGVQVDWLVYDDDRTHVLPDSEFSELMYRSETRP